MNVLVEKNGPVTTVIINRPKRRNAINEETASELLEVFEAYVLFTPFDLAYVCAVEARQFAEGFLGEISGLSENSDSKADFFVDVRHSWFPWVARS